MTPVKLFAFAAFVALPAALFGADAATTAGQAETAKAVTNDYVDPFDEHEQRTRA